MADTKTGQLLTDGTGVSPITLTKFVKDFIADFLITAAAALAVAGISGIPQDQAAWTVASTAILGALVRVGYRQVLRWATTP
jgi:hypothetical protein